MGESLLRNNLVPGFFCEGCEMFCGKGVFSLISLLDEEKGRRFDEREI